VDKREVYRKAYEELQRKLEGGGIPWWRPKVGKNYVRILPNWKDPNDVFYKRVYVHWNVGENNRKVVCRKTLGEDELCPICDFVSELLQSSDSDDVKYGQAMGQTERFAMNILDGYDLERGVQVFECGRGLFQSILWMFTDGDYGDLDDWKTGRYIVIERVGTGMTDTRYNCMPSGKETPIDPKEFQSRLWDLDEVYAPPIVEEMIAILEGRDTTASAEEVSEEVAELLEEEDEVPPPPTPTSKTSKAAGVAPPSPEDFEKAPKPKEASVAKTKEKPKPSFSQNSSVLEKIKKIRRPSSS